MPRTEQGDGYVGVALDIPESKITPAAIFTIKVAHRDLWYVEEDEFRYSHIIELGLVATQDNRFRAFQIVILFVKIVLAWRTQ